MGLNRKSVCHPRVIYYLTYSDGVGGRRTVHEGEWIVDGLRMSGKYQVEFSVEETLQRDWTGLS